MSSLPSGGDRERPGGGIFILPPAAVSKGSRFRHEVAGVRALLLAFRWACGHDASLDEGFMSRLLKGDHRATMGMRWRASSTIAAALLLSLSAVDSAKAASDVGVGGYHELALRAAQDNLLRSSGVIATGDEAHSVELRVDDAPHSALTAFTPRFGGLGLGGAAQAAAVRGKPADHGRTTAPDDPSRQVQVGLSETAEIAGIAIDLSASAGGSYQADRSASESGFVVGGELAVSGLRFDAAYGQDATAFGLDGSRMTAGVAYGFGSLDARMSYSVVERETAVDTSLFTLGSQFALSPGLVVQGDVAYADDENGDATTAGLVSLRLNF